MYERLKYRLNRILAPLDNSASNFAQGEGIPYLDTRQTIRLLTYNIQVGISTSSYRHYLTRSWQHILPHKNRQENLNKIASLLQEYDIVALQEVDGGSLRSGFVNQVEYLADQATFPYWYQQLNRNFGPIAKHSNGLLSKFRPIEINEYTLPSLIPGRGVIVAKYGHPEDPIVLVIMHLSLSKSAQNTQLRFIRDLIEGYRHVVLMGDMNTHAESILHDSPIKSAGLVPLPGVSHTFPSWSPEKALDHILVSRSLEIKKAGVLAFPVSDHLPIALDVKLPDSYSHKS
jgi:endonuclease/exonuclease/phosphatase family metal-dependent hydrolase